MSDRVSWQCPECSRSFRIPASKPRPAWCPDCAAAMGSDGDIDFDVPAEVSKPATKSRFNPSVTVKKGSGSKKTNEPKQTEPKKPTEPSRGTPVPAPFVSAPPVAASSPQTDSEHDDKQQQILDELAKISHTMKFFRRLVWGIAIAMILNVVLMGVGLIYSMSMLSSVGGLLGPSADVDAAIGNAGDQNAGAADLDKLPPGLQEKLKPIEDYGRLLEELAKEPQ
jgi:hypothetical protein